MKQLKGNLTTAKQDDLENGCFRKQKTQVS